MNRETMTKIFSTTLSLALVATSAPVPASAFGPVGPAAPAFVAGLTPPEHFGYVTSSYAPNNEDKPRLVVISDLHGHVEVQKNIVGMLDSLVSALSPQGGAQNRVPIFVEGGWTSKLEEPLKFIQDADLRAFMREYLMRKSEIGAAQTFSELHAGSGKVSLTGVENKDLYEANRAQFVKTYPFRKAVLEALVRREAALKALAQQVEPGAYHKLQSLRGDYDSGKISQEKYAKILVAQASHLGFHGPAVDTLSHVSSSSSQDVEAAFRTVYRAVSMKLSDRRPLSAWMRQSLDKEDMIRKNVARVDSQIDLLTRLVSNQLTPEEVSVALANMSELIYIAQQLLGNEKLGVDVAQVIRESLEFYPYALLRDKALAKNAIAALSAGDTAAPTGILVVGGFHSQAIADYLRNQKISYLMLNPSITRDLSTREQLNYIKRLCGEHVTPDEIAFDVSHLIKGDYQARSGGAALASPVSLSDPAATPDGVKKITGDDPGSVKRMLGLGVAKAIVTLQGTDAARAFASESEARKALTAGDADVAFIKGKIQMEGEVPTEAVLGGRWGNVLAKADSTHADMTLAAGLGTTVSRVNGQFSGNDEMGKAAADIANGIDNYFGRQVNQYVKEIDVQVVTQEMKTQILENAPDSEVKVISDKAILVGLNTGRPVIFVTKEAYSSAYALRHEFTHVFSVEGQERKMPTKEAQVKEQARAEKVVVIESLVLTAAAKSGANTATELGVGPATRLTWAALGAVLQAEWENIPDSSFRDRLAKFIARMENPPTLEDPTVQQIISDLKKEFANEPVSAFQIEQETLTFINRPIVRLNGINPEDEKEVRKNVADDAKKQKKTLIEA